jgi:predicted secreted hydrolase
MKKLSAVALLLVLHSSFAIRNSAFASDFRPALPGYEFSFPRDHGSHDEYKTEWWYYTGQLHTAEGKRFGFELTFFRVGVAAADGPPESRWELRNVSLAHFAITDVSAQKFRYYEKVNRTSPFTAGAAAGYLAVFNESWRASTQPDGSWRIIANAGTDSIDLTLRSTKPPAIHGENGVSIKAQGVGYASHYYSMTNLEATGKVNGHRATGHAWMDHEFGSSALRESQQGWDWFSIQLDNDFELMIYIIRRADGTPDVTSSGSLIADDGRVIPIRRDEMRVTPAGSWKSPKSGATYPMGWRIEVPSMQLALIVKPVMKAQELITGSSTGVTYWEGAVDASGSLRNTSVQGEGYVEMTGYDRAFRAP